MNEKAGTNSYFFVHFDLLQVLPITRSEHQNVPTISETDRFTFTVNEGGSISKISVEQQKIIETFKIDGAVHNIQGSRVTWWKSRWSSGCT